MISLLQVAIGGAMGASLRYLTVQQVVRWAGADVSLGTLLVNLVGCFVMGLLLGAFGARFGMAPLVLTGLLGGFTTFSAFSADTLALFERGAGGIALAYVLVTVVGTVLACFLGVALGRMVAA